MAIVFQQQSKLLISCISIWCGTWAVRCQQDLCSSWVTEPSWYRNMMTVKASLTPANGVINNKTRWAGRELGGGLSGYSTCTSQRAAGADGAAERRDMAWRSWNLWFDICSVWESVRGQEKVFEGPNRFLFSPSLWVLSKRSDLQGTESGGAARWRWSVLNGRWIDVIHPAMSVLLFHVGRGEPSHLGSNKTGYNSGSSTYIWQDIYLFHVLFVFPLLFLLILKGFHTAVLVNSSPGLHMALTVSFTQPLPTLSRPNHPPCRCHKPSPVFHQCPTISFYPCIT